LHPYTKRALFGEEPLQASYQDELESIEPFPPKEPWKGKAIPMTGIPDFFLVFQDEPTNQGKNITVSQEKISMVDNSHQQRSQMDH
jgi:hypothetical protein